MMNVPYVHIVFIVVHELNKLALLNEWVLYNITIRAAWQCVKTLAAESDK